MELNLWVLARRLVPLDAIKRKLGDYIAEGHIAAEDKTIMSNSSKICKVSTESPTCTRHWRAMRVQQKQQTPTQNIGK